MLKQFSNIINYIIGNYRWFLYSRFNGRFIRAHILEQFEYRKKACPSCNDSYEASCCGCDTPQVFFASKGCSNKRYPEMLSKKNWKAFKARKRQWEIFISNYPGGEEDLLKIGIRRNEYYVIIIDILDGAIYMTLDQVKALDVYRKSQFIKIEDTNPNIVLDLDE